MTVSNQIRGKSQGSQPDPDSWFEGSTIAAGVPAVTAGPLADYSDDVDPVEETKQAARRLVKQANAGGGNVDYNSPTGPGFDRGMQQPRGPMGGTGPVMGSSTEEQYVLPASPMDVSKGPDRGLKGAISQARSINVEKGSKTKEPPDELQEPVVKKKEVLNPSDRSRLGNIDSDLHNRSAWTHSGAGGASQMHGGQLKLGFAASVDEPEEQDDPDEEFDDVTDPDASPFEEDAPETDSVDDGEPVLEEVEKVARAIPAIDQETAERRLEFASVPVELVSDPWGVFPAAALEKEAADVNDYLARDDAHPLTLMAIMMANYQSKWIDWEPETIQQTVEADLGVEVSPVNMSKIMAIKVSLKNPDALSNDWHVLEKVTVAFNDHHPSMTNVEDVPPEWLSNSVSILRRMVKFKPGVQVKKYVAARLYDAGYVITPPTLAFADGPLKNLSQDEGLREKVLRSYVDALSGKAPSEDSENPVDIQVQRMMFNHQYVLDRLDESVSQMG